MHWLILIIYTIALSFVFFYSLTQLQLVWAYRKNKSKHSASAPDINDEWPFVTIQLPLYNEVSKRSSTPHPQRQQGQHVVNFSCQTHKMSKQSEL